MQFQQVWELHELSADSKLENIMMIDKMLHETHLGLSWQPFRNKPCRRWRPLKEQSNEPTNQLQPIQSPMKSTNLKCLDRKMIEVFTQGACIKILSNSKFSFRSKHIESECTAQQFLRFILCDCRANSHPTELDAGRCIY